MVAAVLVAATVTVATAAEGDRRPAVAPAAGVAEAATAGPAVSGASTPEVASATAADLAVATPAPAAAGTSTAPGKAATAGERRGGERRRPCTEREHPGGDWPSLNADLGNTRHQAAEDEIGPVEAAGLVPAWSFSGEQVGATGGMRSTPVVAGGCVYLGLGQGYLGDLGHVIALDAETGELVWKAQLDGSVLGLAVANGLVYATPSRGTKGEVAAPVVTDTYTPDGSHAVALDASTGAVRWTSERLDDGNPGNGTFINASPVVFEVGGRDLMFVPLSGGAGDGARVPMYFLDARTGETVAKSYSLTDAEYRAGFGGTGIWSTAAFDPKSGYLYAATADSDGRTRQHPRNNAILRIDADPRRATFATVVGVYSGTSEHADLDPIVGYPNNPACGALGADAPFQPPTFFDTSASVECLELDVDFGSSPNLSKDADGDLVVSALQKSGVFHAVDAVSMQANWRFFVGPGGPAMHAATAAVGPDRVYVGATPNLVFGLDRLTGSLGWASTTSADLFAYQPITLANDVLYTINDLGLLVGLRARDGAPVVQRPIAVDGGFRQCLGVGAGVAVARHTVFVPCDAGGPVDLAGVPVSAGGLVAYRAG